MPESPPCTSTGVIQVTLRLCFMLDNRPGVALQSAICIEVSDSRKGIAWHGEQSLVKTQRVSLYKK